MYATPHIESNLKGYDNTGSCKIYAEYLTKENQYFFNHTNDYIDLNSAVEMIDKHSTGQLGKKEAKWYAPVYSLSEKEAQFIAKKICGRDVTDYEELSLDEKKIYNQQIRELAKSFQDEMAKNFDKERLGISSGKDLMYIGVVENQRTYKGTDQEVLVGQKKQGERKSGFNTHIHIIQSRKANNKRKSKISPMSKVKSAEINLKGRKSKMGFDRNKFYQNIEKKFDQKTGYNRELKEHFQYKKAVKIKRADVTELNDENKKKVQNMIKNAQELIEKNRTTQQKKKYINKKEITSLINNAKIVDYFFGLVEKEKMEFIKSENDEYIFQEVESKALYYVSKSKNKWNCFSKKEGGGIIKAIQALENKSWLDAVWLLKEKEDYKTREEWRTKKKEWEEKQKIWKQKYEEKLRRAQATEVVDEIEVRDNKIMDNLVSLGGIYKSTLGKKCTQVKYKTPEGREFWGFGMKNISGGWTIHNGKFETKAGKSDIIYQPGYKSNKELLVFDNMVNYLRYLNIDSMLSMTNHPEDVIILNGNENLKNLEKIIQNKNYKVSLISGSDKIKKELSSVTENITDYRERFREKLQNNSQERGYKLK